MRTRRSWRNQERIWRYLGGKRATTKRTRPKRLTPPAPATSAWDRYSVLFDAGEFEKALPHYAQHLKEKTQK